MGSTPPSKNTSNPDIPGIYSSDNISLDVPSITKGGRPAPVKYMSAPAYQSPLRHHKRAASSTRQVKETLNARSEYSNSEDDGTAQHRINQYLIRQEIGRGSFGAVHLAVDQFGNEYAVKEFSKSRLRKRAQSNLLRRPSARRRRQGALAAGVGFNSPLHRHSTTDIDNNSLELIREEIAIMKKLNHPNLVSLIEVLDDPEEDSLYMVMEMCKKGVVMQVGLEERADPYDEEQCRCWFRDMILGIEYLHAQGIIHRDIKPDNCLITDDDVLKIVDFGVSEMFEKESDMKTAKSAGSPAFMPPELCVPKHGPVSGKAADIWSMGVTLFCLKLGRIPFEKFGMIELYQAIRNDTPDFGPAFDDDLKDLLLRMLEKDPEKRINMEQLRRHPWVTKQGSDPLLTMAENVAVIVEPPTDEEVNAAITGHMDHLVTVVRAVKRFKQLLFRKRPELMEGILGSASRIVQPPLSIHRPSYIRKTKSQDTDDRRPIETALTAEGVHRELSPAGLASQLQKHIDGLDELTATTTSSGSLEDIPDTPPGTKTIHDTTYRPTRPKPVPIRTSPAATATPPNPPHTPVGKGHAHDPLEDTLFLNIGTGANDLTTPTSDNPDPLPIPIVSESPSNVDMNVYETAYQEEIQRIMKRKEETGRRPTLYLTRRVEGNKSIRENEFIFDTGKQVASEAKAGFAALKAHAKEKIKEDERRGGYIGRGYRSVKDLKDAVQEIKAQNEERERLEAMGILTPERSRTPVDGRMKKERKGSGTSERSKSSLKDEKSRSKERIV